MNLYIISSIILLLLNNHSEARRPDKRRHRSFDPKVFTTCYENIGCIDVTEKWYDEVYRPHNFEPLDRHTIRTEFILMKPLKNDTKELIYDILSLKKESIEISGFKRSKCTIFCVHDFTGNGYTGWVKHLVIAFSKRNDCNMVSIDWEAGAEPPFEQAIANARVVALEAQAMIRMLQGNFSQKLDKIHIIGHGVGAHIAGYIGKNVSGIGRITGLDPTGPFFENMPAEIKLDHTDAAYVEILHTDAYRKKSQGGMIQLGHADFYINNAGKQPGCNDSLNMFSEINRDCLKEGKILPACSHKRAFKYFIESIENTECQFLGMQCKNYEEFEKGNCFSCDGNKCLVFGIDAPSMTTWNHSYYLIGREKQPFCVIAYTVEITLDTNSKAKETEGYFDMILIDKNNTVANATTTASDYKYRVLKPGGRYQYLFYASPPKLGHIKEAKVKWTSRSGKLCIFCTTSVFVKELEIKLLTLNNTNVESSHLCPSREISEIENGDYVTFAPCNSRSCCLSETAGGESSSISHDTNTNASGENPVSTENVIISSANNAEEQFITTTVTYDHSREQIFSEGSILNENREEVQSNNNNNEIIQSNKVDSGNNVSDSVILDGGITTINAEVMTTSINSDSSSENTFLNSDMDNNMMLPQKKVMDKIDNVLAVDKEINNGTKAANAYNFNIQTNFKVNNENESKNASKFKTVLVCKPNPKIKPALKSLEEFDFNNSNIPYSLNSINSEKVIPYIINSNWNKNSKVLSDDDILFNQLVTPLSELSTRTNLNSNLENVPNEVDKYITNFSELNKPRKIVFLSEVNKDISLENPALLKVNGRDYLNVLKTVNSGCADEKPDDRYYRFARTRNKNRKFVRNVKENDFGKSVKHRKRVRKRHGGKKRHFQSGAIYASDSACADLVDEFAEDVETTTLRHRKNLTFARESNVLLDDVVGNSTNISKESSIGAAMKESLKHTNNSKDTVDHENFNKSTDSVNSHNLGKTTNRGDNSLTTETTCPPIIMHTINLTEMCANYDSIDDGNNSTNITTNLNLKNKGYEKNVMTDMKEDKSSFNHTNVGAANRNLSEHKFTLNDPAKFDTLEKCLDELVNLQKTLNMTKENCMAVQNKNNVDNNKDDNNTDFKESSTSSTDNEKGNNNVITIPDKDMTTESSDKIKFTKDIIEGKLEEHEVSKANNIGAAHSNTSNYKFRNDECTTETCAPCDDNIKSDRLHVTNDLVSDDKESTTENNIGESKSSKSNNTSVDESSTESSTDLSVKDEKTTMLSEEDSSSKSTIIDEISSTLNDEDELTTMSTITITNIESSNDVTTVINSDETTDNNYKNKNKNKQIDNGPEMMNSSSKSPKLGQANAGEVTDLVFSNIATTTELGKIDLIGNNLTTTASNTTKYMGRNRETTTQCFTTDETDRLLEMCNAPIVLNDNNDSVTPSELQILKNKTIEIYVSKNASALDLALNDDVIRTGAVQRHSNNFGLYNLEGDNAKLHSKSSANDDDDEDGIKMCANLNYKKKKSGRDCKVNEDNAEDQNVDICKAGEIYNDHKTTRYPLVIKNRIKSELHPKEKNVSITVEMHPNKNKSLHLADSTTIKPAHNHSDRAIPQTTEEVEGCESIFGKLKNISGYQDENERLKGISQVDAGNGLCCFNLSALTKMASAKDVNESENNSTDLHKNKTNNTSSNDEDKESKVNQAVNNTGNTTLDLSKNNTHVDGNGKDDKLHPAATDLNKNHSTVNNTGTALRKNNTLDDCTNYDSELSPEDSRFSLDDIESCDTNVTLDEAFSKDINKSKTKVAGLSNDTHKSNEDNVKQASGSGISLKFNDSNVKPANNSGDTLKLIEDSDKSSNNSADILKLNEDNVKSSNNSLDILKLNEDNIKPAINGISDDIFKSNEDNLKSSNDSVDIPTLNEDIIKPTNGISSDILESNEDNIKPTENAKETTDGFDASNTPDGEMKIPPKQNSYDDSGVIHLEMGNHALGAMQNKFVGTAVTNIEECKHKSIPSDASDVDPEEVHYCQSLLQKVKTFTSENNTEIATTNLYDWKLLTTENVNSEETRLKTNMDVGGIVASSATTIYNQDSTNLDSTTINPLLMSQNNSNAKTYIVGIEAEGNANNITFQKVSGNDINIQFVATTTDSETICETITVEVDTTSINNGTEISMQASNTNY